jgi:3-oxoadipate enol-lactonase
MSIPQTLPYSVQGNGPPLVYLPGLDGTGQLFYRQAASLASHFTVITYNLRQDPPFTYADLMADLAALIQHCQAAPINICAESFGGTLALQFALNYPQLVRSLIIVNSFPYFRNRQLLIAGLLLAEFVPYEFIQWGRYWAVNWGWLGEDIPVAEKSKFLAITTTIPKLAIRQRLKLIYDFDVRPQLPALKIPLLLLASGRDRLQDSVAEAQLIASQITTAQLQLLPKYGHLPLLAGDCQLTEILLATGFWSLMR